MVMISVYNPNGLNLAYEAGEICGGRTSNITFGEIEKRMGILHPYKAFANEGKTRIFFDEEDLVPLLDVSLVIENVIGKSRESTSMGSSVNVYVNILPQGESCFCVLNGKDMMCSLLECIYGDDDTVEVSISNDDCATFHDLDMRLTALEVR